MENTIVITGASSGIGLAIALRLAMPGVNLALIARRRQPLDDVAARCRLQGANVLVLTGDMGNEEDVGHIYQKILLAYDGFVVWINNASVGAYGSFLDITNEQFQKVLQTNVMGYVHGARTALAHYRENGQGGILINIASALGAFPGPYTSPYVASKYAVRGLSAALRQELMYEKRKDIQVCTVLPATIDTPFYDHAANLTGKELQAMQPVYPAEAVATAVIRLIQHPKSEVVVGGIARLPKLLYGIAPGLAERAMAHYVARLSYKNTPSPTTEGNLFDSGNEYARSSGGWNDKSRHLITAAFVIGAALVARGVMRKRKEK
jgi:short-subunit dehydrogenase